MNVLHVISGRGPTGPAAAALEDAKSLRAAGHTVWVAARDGSTLMRFCQAQGLSTVGGLSLGRGAMRILKLPGDARRLRAIVRECAIDTVHVHRTDDQLLAAAALGRRLTTKLIRTWHRDPSATPRLLLARVARYADGCITVSHNAAEALRKAGAPRAEYIPVGVDTTVYKPADASQEPGARSQDPQSPLIGQIGRWKREADGRDRGQRAALDVLELLPPDLAWNGVLIGRGEKQDELRREVLDQRRLPPGRVTLLNAIVHSSPEFAAILGTLSIGLVFNAGSDGTSRAAAEMLACGVPVLLADLPGLRELAGDPASALALPCSEPRRWAEALERLLRDLPALRRMSAAARARAEAVHALPVRGAALAEFYRNA